MSSEWWNELAGWAARAEGLDAEEREALLRECRAKRPALAEELKALLSDSPSVGFLTPPETPGTVLLQGIDLCTMQFGPYQPLRELGRGGYGVVLLARRAGDDRLFALKVIPSPEALASAPAERFEREIRAASSLEHDSIVKVHAHGSEGAFLWLAMDYVEGHDLHREIGALGSRGSDPESSILPPFDSPDYVPTVVAGLLRLAEGLGYAHESGVIHRDIKPPNILIDREGRFRLVDFGLARMEGDSTITRTDAIQGTLPYMSPEQARLLESRIDSRTDVYSLCVVLYELLSLRRPFDGDSPNEILTRIASGSHAALRTHNERISKDLALVCETGMALNPDFRYPNASALADDLRRILGFQSISARPPALRHRVRRFLLRHRWAASVLGGLVAALLILTLTRHFTRRSMAMESVATRIEWALDLEDWNDDLPRAITAHRAAQEYRAGDHRSPRIEGLLDEFAHHRTRFLSESLDSIRAIRAGRPGTNPMERTADLLGSVRLAEALRGLDPESEELAALGEVASVYPTVEVILPTDTPSNPPPGRLRVWRIHEVHGTPAADSEVFSLEGAPIPLPPGIYRLRLEFPEASFEFARALSQLGTRHRIEVQTFAPRARWDRTVLIPGGEFVPDDPCPLGCVRSLDSVRIEPFLIDEAVVSNREYLNYLDESGREPPAYWKFLGYERGDWSKLPVEGVGARWLGLPATGMSWEDARAFAEWYGMRLPTHFELEWAFRGPENLRRPWGDAPQPSDILANIFKAPPVRRLSPRDSYREALECLVEARAEGYRHPPHDLFHAYGNVWEWTSSHSIRADGTSDRAIPDGRIQLGGAWDIEGGQAIGSLCDHAHSLVGDASASPRVGFRCVRNP